LAIFNRKDSISRSNSFFEWTAMNTEQGFQTCLFASKIKTKISEKNFVDRSDILVILKA